MKKEIVVISLGGSIIVPDQVDSNFLKKFRIMILSQLRKYKFVLITGGGKTCRRYNSAAAKVRKLNHLDLDWLGIHATRFNAELVKTIFKGVAHSKIVEDPTKKIKFDNILVGCGWKPGCSSDYDAVLLAKSLGAKTVINMSNIDTLYDKDPNKFKSAKKVLSIDWKGMRKLVGDKWIPGMNVPFDPKATKLAASLGLKLVILGKNVDNLKNYLQGKKFKGSIVEG